MDLLKRLLGQQSGEEPQPPPEPEPESELPKLEKEPKPEPKDFMEIGRPPVPGLTLRRVLRGHTDSINRITWSPDGQLLASPSADSTIRIWDIEAIAKHRPPQT